MKATDSYVGQRIIEIEGRSRTRAIACWSPSKSTPFFTTRTASWYCENAWRSSAEDGRIEPRRTRNRSVCPFDEISPNWNEKMPQLVIRV